MSLSRRTPLRRGSPLRRRTWIRAVNPERRAARYADAYGGRGDAVRARPCLCAGRGCWGPMEAAHVVSRGAGGGARDLVPLCRGHHREQHSRGVRTFAEDYGLDLAEAARRLAEELDHG